MKHNRPTLKTNPTLPGHWRILLLLTALALFGATALRFQLAPAQAQGTGTTILINSTAQEATAENFNGLANGTCTLGEAILSANTNSDIGGCVRTGSGEPFTLALSQATYTLTTIHHYEYGPAGLPPIASRIVIQGNGAIIERDTNAPRFRLLYVSGGLSYDAGTQQGLVMNRAEQNGATSDGNPTQTANPNLQPLALNAPGLTPTMALTAASASTRDQGVCPGHNPQDQRGVSRPFGAACDLGAYEFINTSPTIQATAGVTRQQGSPAANQAIATVNDQETAPGDLLVSATSLPAGITLTNLSNSGGQITANFAATCAATPGANLIGLEVTDGSGATATATLTVNVTANTPPTLSYTAQNVIVGGTQAFNPSALPGDNGQIVSIGLHSATPSVGLTLTVESSTGHVSITGATQPGNYSIVIRATDNCGAITDASFTVTAVCPAITLAPASLPAGQAGVSYSQTISATPANGYSYSLQSGSLPSGLMLNPVTGSLSGLPTVTGTHGFTIKAQAASGCSGTKSFTLVIGCPTVSLPELPAPALNTAYNQTLTVVPAGGSYSFAVTAGALPAGLSLNSATGAISGTPVTSGSVSFTITATGFGGCAGSRSYSFTIGAGGCPAITLPALASGAVGQMFNQSVAASPSGSYSYAVTAGSLPPGVTLYANGLLFGYPTGAGSYAFTITATGAGACTGSRAYSVAIQ